MHFVATGLPFSRATCNFIPLTRHARAAMAISTSEIRTDDVLSVPAPLPLCECESAKATLARAMSRAVAIANAGFVTVKSLHLRLVARMSAELIHRRRCECRRDVMRGLQTIVTCVRMGTRYAPLGRVSQRRPLAFARGANARPSGCRTRGSARGRTSSTPGGSCLGRTCFGALLLGQGAVTLFNVLADGAGVTSSLSGASRHNGSCLRAQERPATWQILRPLLQLQPSQPERKLCREATASVWWTAS
jgi:hypothetical protein